ncbi:protein sidekick-2-like [Montipora capricornis]|uniref:protein sidekick-2-like n=1 Tax=Montipora capricornis TaxID=246305 RepID=UPI0035F186A1
MAFFVWKCSYLWTTLILVNNILSQETAPSPPRNLQLRVVSSTSIEASWDEPETKNGNIRHYAVSYGKNRLDSHLYTTETKYLLTSLDENTLYSVQVTAETSVSGNPSGTKQATTLEDAPSSDPVIKKGREGTKAEDAHTIRVVWEEIPQKDQNGVIIGYSVFYNEKGQSEYFSENATASQTSALIGGLKPFTIYCIKIAGYTKVGRSPLRDPCHEVKTLQKGPSHPRDVMLRAKSSTSILVSWKEPALKNGIITNYIISYGQEKHDQETEAQVTGSTFQRLLTDLRKFTTYYIKVRGKTTELGNASRLLNATTFEDRK